MRTVALTGTTISTSALGFGTASLMGKLDKNESLRLLAVAYEKGIRHFDTAPSYGYGESEAVLGEFLAGKTDATVATKFGLSRPQTGSIFFRRAKGIARPLLRAFPNLRGVARKAVHDGLATRSSFDPGAAAAGLKRSLRLLRRERIELLLLHECRQTDLHDDRLLEFLRTAKSRGQIDLFGVATDITTIDYCLTAAPAYADVVQFPNNSHEPNIERRPALVHQRVCITHSPFGGFGKTALANVPSALNYAAQQNPSGIIIFSSQHAHHIVSNIESFN